MGERVAGLLPPQCVWEQLPWGEPLGLGSAHLCGLAYAPPQGISKALFTNTGQKPLRSPRPQPYKSDILGLNGGH